MQGRLLNINKMIRLKGIQEVVSQNIGGPGSLFDQNIFGYGESAAYTYGYIKLNGPVVHPLLYAISSRTWRDLPLIINGTKKFVIDESGDLVPDENGNTGLTWLYNNFDKISLKKLKDDTNAKLTTKKLKLAYDSLTKEKFFIDKILVLPLHFRDLDTDSGSVKMDELNQLYIDLIRAAEFRSRMTFESHWNDMKMQGIVNSIFDYFNRATNDKKTGILKSSAMGRNVDNSIRLVIVAPEIRPKDIIGKSRYSLGNISIPLHHYINGSPVHALSAAKKVLQTFFDYGKFGDLTQEAFDNHFSDEHLVEYMENFDHSQLERLKPVKGPNGETVSLYFEYNDDSGTTLKETREMTWVDLFLYAVQLYKDNIRAVATRYPVTDKDSNIFVKPFPSVFVDDFGDCKIYLDKDSSEPIYEFEDCYPNVSKYIKNTHLIDRAFEETMRLSNLVLSKLGADFDKVFPVEVKMGELLESLHI